MVLLELHKLVSELGKLLSYFWWYGEVVQILYEPENYCAITKALISVVLIYN